MTSARLGLDPAVLFRLDYHEQVEYIVESAKQKKREERARKELAYMSVIWNRIEPKDIPPLDQVLGLEDDEKGTSAKEQTPEEMESILKTLAVRSKNNKTVSRRGN